MPDKAEKIKSRKKLIAALIIIAVVAVVGLFGYSGMQSMARQVSVDIPETIVLTKTNLENKITASGNFTSMAPVSVGSNVQGGEVEYVFVDVGSRVAKGEALARLKTSDIERNITDTRVTIAETLKGDRERVEAAQRAFDDADATYKATDRQTRNAVNKAETAVADAEKAFTNADKAWTDKKKALDKAVADAKKALDAAEKELKDTMAADPPATPEEIKDKTEKRDKAKAAHEAAKASRDGVKAARDSAEAALGKAREALDAARDQRENSLQGVNSNWYNAKANLDSLKGVDSSRQQRSQLETLNENLDNASIISPITGIVTNVFTEAGKAAMGDMFMIENTETLEISAVVAEYDVIKITEGMEAHITSNATDDQTYDGKVIFVAPIASDTSGNFEVKVLMTSPVGLLKPGMTATIEIVTASKKDVFAVPIDAVVELPDGRKVVYAYELEQAKPGAGGGPVTADGSAGEGPVVLDSSALGPAPSDDGAGDGAGGGPVTTDGSAGGGPVTTDGNASGLGRLRPNAGEGPMMMLAGNDANGAAGERREIEVKTGMETDYYIEIISDELIEGMLILSDPLGRNVRVSSGPMFGGMGGPQPGGQAVYVESGSSQSVTVVN